MTPFALDLAVKGTLLLVLAFGTALLLRRASAAARHLHWQLALGGLLALPLLVAVTPRLPVPAGPLASLLAQDEAPRAARPHVRTETRPENRAETRPDTRLAQDDPGRDARRETARASIEPGESAPAAQLPAVLPAARARAPERAAAAPPPVFTFHFALTPLQRVLLAWSAGAALVLAMLGLGLLRARSLSRRATPVTDPEWLALADRARCELSLHRSVELRRVPASIVPMTFGWRRPIVLLPADSDGWSRSRRRHVLLHELAHVRRGDWLGQIAAQIACAAWWWQPLTWMAARELRRHREAACDDAVLAAGNRASEYAGDLLAIASSRQAGLATGAATLAMARRSQLEGRLLAVLEGGRRRAGLTPRRVLAASAGAAALVAALACVQPRTDERHAGEPVPPAEQTGQPEVATNHAVARTGPDGPTPNGQAPDGPAPTPRMRDAPRRPPPAMDAPPPAVAPDAPAYNLYVARPPLEDPQFARAAPLTLNFSSMLRMMPASRELHFSFDDGDGDCESTCVWSWSQDGEHLTVTAKGSYSSDETGTKLAWIDEDGSFVIEHQLGDVSDRLEARMAQDEEDNDLVAWSGSMGGKTLSGEEAGAAANKLLERVLAETGLFASERVNHLVEHGGAAHALEVIRAMPAGMGRDEMLRCLVTEHELESEELAGALALAAEGTDGGAALADMLAQLDGDVLGDPDLVEPVFKAVDTIESDCRQADVLSSLLSNSSADAPVVRRALESATKGLDSDAYASEFLLTIPPGRLRDPGVRDAWLALYATIESDAYAAETLSPVLDARGVKGETLAALLDAATRGIDSDAYMAQVLGNAPPRALADEAPRQALVVALGTIESDAYQSEVLQSLLSEATPAIAAALLPVATAGVESDAYMAELLQSLPVPVAHDAAVKPALDAALATIQSKAYRDEVRETLELVQQV